MTSQDNIARCRRPASSVISKLILLCNLATLLTTTTTTSALNQSPSGLQTMQASWKGITPLVSRRAEVEQILGKPRTITRLKYIYQSENQRIDVWYAAGKCEPGGEAWKVEEGVVLKIDVIPNKSVLVDELGLDLKAFVKTEWTHPREWITYKNEENGIAVEVILPAEKVEVVRFISYFPNKENSKRLRCE
jgi:hypothetical protein